MRPSAAVALVLLMIIPSSAFAGAARPWLAVDGSLATYTMSDVNGEIQTGNYFLSIAGSGARMKAIHGGLGAGAAVGVELLGRFSLGLGYNRLLGSSEASDATVSSKYDVSANAYRAFGQYSSGGLGKSSAHLGGSLGVVKAAGNASVLVPGSSEPSGRFGGSGALFEVFAGGDIWASSQFAVSGSGGYRYAKVSNATLNGTPAYANGRREALDYRGVFLRVGIKFAPSAL